MPWPRTLATACGSQAAIARFDQQNPYAETSSPGESVSPSWSCSEARGQCHYPEDKPWLPSLTSASAGCFILAKLLGSRGPGAPVSWQLGSAQHLCGQVNPPFPSRLPPPPFPKEAAGRRLRLEPSVPTRPTDLQRVLASLPPGHIFPADSSRNSHFFSFLKLGAVSWNTCNSPRS